MTTRSSTNQVSATPEPLRPTIVPGPSSEEMTTAATAAVTTERTRGVRRTHDPRQSLRLSPRDQLALAFVAKMGFAAQYQLHIACFGGRSEVVVSRCVRRLRKLGLIEILRWNRTGINLLKLTGEGRRVVIDDAGVAETKVFTVRWPTASGLAHALWIIDIALALRTVAPTLDVLPCWSLRRRFAGTTQPVPDLLAVGRAGAKTLAVEVDLGGENIRRIIFPRLRTLDEALVSWGATDDRAIFLFMSSRRRVDVVQRLIDREPPGCAVLPLVLPRVVGRPAVEALGALLTT